MIFSCGNTNIEGRYVLNAEETKKNLKDKTQLELLDRILGNMSLFDIEIKEDSFIWIVTGMGHQETDRITNRGKGVLTIVSSDNKVMKIKYGSGKIYIPDPIMGMDIVFSKKK